MRIIHLEKKYIPRLKLFLEIIKKDFLPTKRRERGNLGDYFSDRNKFMLLAVEEEDIIGYLAYEITDKRGRIIGIGIMKEFRQRGIGKELIKKAMELMIDKGVEEIISKTWQSNCASIKLFEGCGFVRYKTIKRDRINGESTFWFRYRSPK